MKVLKDFSGVLNKETTMALGSAKLENYVTANFSIKLVKEALEIIEKLKEEYGDVTIALGKNKPMVLGYMGKDGKMAGVFVAPLDADKRR